MRRNLSKLTQQSVHNSRDYLAIYERAQWVKKSFASSWPI